MKANQSYNDIIINLYNSIRKYAALWRKQHNDIQVSFKHFTNDELSLVPNINYYDDLILEKIKMYDKAIYSYNFKTGNRDINIHFIAAYNKKEEEKEIREHIKKIFIWMHIIEGFANIQCSQKLNIYLFLTPLLKLMPREFGATISTSNANSAFTFSCNMQNNIHIFRKEEWFKVFIHECFHNLGLDFSKIDNGFSDKHIALLFPLHIDFRLYESYCESWALLINSIFCSYFENPKQNSKVVLKNVENILNRERQFSLFQCSKILHHFGMSYTDLYTKSEGASFARLNRYKEDTPLLSYFFIKTLIVLHYPEFIHWCNTNNENPYMFTTTDDDKTYKKIEKFVDFIKEIYQSKTVLSAMENSMIKFKEQLKIGDLNDTYEIRNLRMSIADT